MKITLKIKKKQIEIKDYITRSIDREYQKFIFSTDTKLDKDWKPDLSFKMERVQDAQDFLVEQMTNLSKTEIDDLPKQDYDQILVKVQNMQKPSK